MNYSSESQNGFLNILYCSYKLTFNSTIKHRLNAFFKAAIFTACIAEIVFGHE